jgi:hypothetical protein
MKKIYLLLSMLLFVTIFAFVRISNSIVGNWKIVYPAGTQVSLEFRKNGTFKTEIPSEHFIVEGKYKMKGDILYISDTSCGAGYWSKYKYTFFSNDSVYSAVIEDSCSGRKAAADKATWVRVKN